MTEGASELIKAFGDLKAACDWRDAVFADTNSDMDKINFAIRRYSDALDRASVVLAKSKATGA